MSINLLPEDIRVHHNNKKKRALILILLFLYSCFFISTNGFLYYKVKIMDNQQERWRSLQAEYQAAEETLAQLDAELDILGEEKNALEVLLNKKQQQSAIISLIIEHIPQYLRIKQLLVTEEGWATLSGEALFLEEVSRLIGTLEKKAIFKEVMLTELEADGKTGVVSFAIDLLFNK